MKLKTGILFFCTVFSIVACNNSHEPEKPKNLISKGKMVAVLLDAKFIASVSSVNRRIMQENGVNIDTYVYKKHGIDSLQFALSNNYYAFHLDDYKEIYEKLDDSLEALKTKFKDLEAAEWKEKTKREEDSLKTIQKEKDSLKLNEKSKDTLKIQEKKKDSIRRRLVKDSISKKMGGGKLISPLSDKSRQ